MSRIQPIRPPQHRPLYRAKPLAGALLAARHLQPGAGAPPPNPGANPYDFSTDAAYQQTLALLGKQRGAASASALNRRKQLAIDYGDPAFARALGLDPSTLAAAGQNPFSVFAQEKRAAETQPRLLDENLNQQNLYWSSTAGQQQSDLQRSLLQGRAEAAGKARASAGSIEDALAAALSGADQQQIQAAQDAANRRQAQLGDLSFAAPVQPKHKPKAKRTVSPIPWRRF